MRRTNRVGIAAAALIVAGCAGAGTPGPAAPAVAPTSATPAPAAAPALAPVRMRAAAPNIRFQDAAGAVHTLDEWKGKFVVLLFFSHTCGICQKEVPNMQEFAAKYGPDAAVLAIEASGASPDQVAAFGKAYNVSMPLYHDESRNAGDAFLVTFFPQAYIVTPDQIVQEDVRGAATVDFYKNRMGLYVPGSMPAPKPS